MCLKCRKNEKENCATLNSKMNKCAICPGYSGKENVRNVRLQCGSTLKVKAASNTQNDATKILRTKRSTTDNEQLKRNCCSKYNKIIEEYFSEANHSKAKETTSHLDPKNINDIVTISDQSSILSAMAPKVVTTEPATPPISYKGSNDSEKMTTTVPVNLTGSKLEKKEVPNMLDKECADCNRKTDKSSNENSAKQPASNPSSGYNRNISEKFQYFSSLNEEITASKILKMQGLAESQKKSSTKKILDPQPANMKTTKPECQKCCRDGNCKVKQLFDAVQDTPVTIIEEYKKSAGINLNDDDNKIVFTKECPFLLTKTHGEPVGEAKYHFLMVDGRTSTSSKINASTITTVETLPIAALTQLVDDIKREKVEQKSEVKNLETTTEQDNQTPPSILIKPNDQSDEEKGATKKENSSNDDNVKQHSSASLPENASAQNLLSTINDKPIGDDEKFDFDFPSASDDKPTTSTDMKNRSIDLQMEDYGDSSGRRVSISWTKDVDHDPPPDRENVQRNVRRASQVSWTFVDQDKTELAEVRKKDLQPRKSTKGSLLDQILKEERLKNIPRKKSMLLTSDDSLNDKDKRISIVVNTSTEPQKKKCCGLFKKKKPKSNMKSSKSGQSTSSKSSKTIKSMQRLDSDSSESSDISFEKDEDQGSRRSSTESYQKRSLTISNPVSERNKTISKYLSNIH